METKTIPLTSSELGESGGITGYASTKNQIDSLGDMIVDGAYGDLPKFVRQGFVTISHDTKSAPIGYILEAKEDAKGLWVKMAFHSTPSAQHVRTVLLERLKAGKEVGLSIGYLAKKWTFESFDGQRVRVLREIERHGSVRDSHAGDLCRCAGELEGDDGRRCGPDFCQCASGSAPD